MNKILVPWEPGYFGAYKEKGTTDAGSVLSENW